MSIGNRRTPAAADISQHPEAMEILAECIALWYFEQVQGAIKTHAVLDPENQKESTNEGSHLRPLQLARTGRKRVN